MHVEGVAIIPAAPNVRRTGCRLTASAGQAWLTDDEPPELVFYCRECAQREFGETGLDPAESV
jgi:hypothetical protein